MGLCSTLSEVQRQRQKMEKKPRLRKAGITIMSVRCTAEEKTKLDAVAGALGTTAHAIMQKAMAEIIGNAPYFAKDDLSKLDAAIVEINAIGRNLNQITRAAQQNPAKIVIEADLINEVSARISALSKAIVTIANRQTDRWKEAIKSAQECKDE